MPFGLGIVSTINNLINRESNEYTNWYNAQVQREINKENLAFTEKWNQTNYNFAREQYEQQIRENQIQRDREDTATSRAVKDLQRNGFNKLLAVGNQAGASGGNVTQVSPNTQNSAGLEASKANPDQFDISSSPQLLGMIQDMKESNARISKSKEEENLIKAQTLTEGERVLNMQADTLLKQALEAKSQGELKNIQQQLKNLSKQYEQQVHDLDISERFGLPGGTDPRVNNIYQGISAIVALLAEKWGGNWNSRDVTTDEGTLKTAEKENNYIIKKDGGEWKIYCPDGKIQRFKDEGQAQKWLHKNKIDKKLWSWT